jgi:hypothetical protein
LAVKHRESPPKFEKDLDHLLKTTRPGTIVDREDPPLHHRQGADRDDTEPAGNEIPPITIENYLKDLMAIQPPRVDNSELLGGIDCVSLNIVDCINLAEASLRKKKSCTKSEETSPRPECSGNIFSGLDRIDDKIVYCIKLVENTLNAGSRRSLDLRTIEKPRSITHNFVIRVMLHSARGGSLF